MKLKSRPDRGGRICLLMLLNLVIFLGGVLGLAQAQVTDNSVTESMPVTECGSPHSLNQAKIVFVTDPNYAPDDPFADRLIEMDFSKNSYVFVELEKNRSFIGAYKYRKLAQNVGYLEGRDAIGSYILRYSITLVCKNALEGRYIFSQEKEGAVFDINQNMGRYYIYP
ncbi:hypothetical protein [uncultured Shewanella sp.]|uniref:hypothetical protein n=1 Tax=uncultured Shewanella sp. TaxID=173975 RepID=UPI00262E6B86|nr:hypothetical protein [uncultured Shewanella sp.]